ncbi:hypothetical protein SEA_EVY_244 [Streptomyces phage Evy]|uniref:Uncharacterized protein n=3 Tax=Samistivirus TaxID=2560220 RepID=A0A514DJV5_9CAUD|nr:hypothetical protein AXJ18_gp008 [Streptomyces phage Jay2Jay]YP_009225943.1 hypothetical protein AXJ18_gp058 [Streptomyces phage Jay2Jay]YP_010103384.1 hypothetical protein KNU67_gp006 [Streptomyces phage Evy]YP_010103587.1 hypothetical protein KNU67_gp054 [Streptomyces phage Evy]ASN73083.1 hypothetical protein SEA_WARPY_8 [Streptomyces phage Warpy]UEM46795.1 hypothetical protein SEA_TARGARYEN_6 [Streptomyces phage Targaryen]AIW02507.1 hypothetical protein PBI_JAY2JAY_8 [Streptomyces phage
MSVIIEIDTPDDDAHDSAWPFATATAEFIAKVLGVSVSVSDGYGTTQDFGGEGGA